MATGHTGGSDDAGDEILSDAMNQYDPPAWGGSSPAHTASTDPSLANDVSQPTKSPIESRSSWA